MITIVLVAAGLLAALLFWFGLVKSHWVAPLTLFTASAPLVAALSWDQDALRILIHLAANLALFYAAFAIGRGIAGEHTSER